MTRRPAPPIMERNASTRCGCSRLPAGGRSGPRCRLATGCEEARRVRAGDRDGPRVAGARRRRSAGHAPHHGDGSADRRSRAPTEPDGTCSLRRPRLGSRGLPDRDGVAHASRHGHLGPVLPRPRRGPGCGDDAGTDLPGGVLEGDRPDLGRSPDAEPLELEGSRDRRATPPRSRRRSPTRPGSRTP